MSYGDLNATNIKSCLEDDDDDDAIGYTDAVLVITSILFESK